MLQAFALFAKQVLSLGGFRVGQVPAKAYQALLTAFSDMLDHDVVMIEPLLKLVKAFPKGRLVIDDTSNPKYGLKQWARKLKILTHSGYQDGYKVLLFLWEGDWGRIPIGFALWHRHSKSLNELAMEGLSLLRNRYDLSFETVLADAAFATDKLFKRLEDYGWPCVMRFKGNRKLSNYRIDKQIGRGWGETQGLLKNGSKLKVFRCKNRFFATNRMLWSRKKALGLYQKRWKVEEVFRAIKGCLRLNGCQQHSMRAQTLYLLLCFILFACLELNPSQSVYAAPRSVISGDVDLKTLIPDTLFSSF